MSFCRITPKTNLALNNSPFATLKAYLKNIVPEVVPKEGWFDC